MHIKRIPIVEKYIDKKNEKEKIIKAKDILLREVGYELISKVENTLADKGVMFFLDFGSLLGIIRDGKLIEYDRDIDYGIVISEYFTWKDLEMSLNNQGFKLIKQFSLDGNITEQTYVFNNLTVDFFCHYKDNLQSYVYEYYRKKGYIYNSKYEYHVAKVNLKTVEHLKKIKIDNINITIPSDSDKYLESAYTDKWTERNPEWCANMCPGYLELDEKIAYIKYFY